MVKILAGRGWWEKKGLKNPRDSRCDKCKGLKENSKKGYCNRCSADYMREWRKSHPMTEQQRFKHNVRRKTNQRIERGLLIKQTCEICDDINVEAHHEDYNNPYDIKWLCRKHHLEHHKKDIK